MKQTEETTTVGLTVGKGVIGNGVLVDQGGVSGETNRAITAELMARIGGAVGSLKTRINVGVACNRSRCGQAFVQALSGGVLAAGGNLLDFGEKIGAEYDFCLQESDAEIGVYIDSNILTNVVITEKGELPRPLEQTLEQAIDTGKMRRAGWNGFGARLDMTGLGDVYRDRLLQGCRADLRGMAVTVRSSDFATAQRLREILKQRGCTLRNGQITLILSPDGRGLSIYSGGTGRLMGEPLADLLKLAKQYDTAGSAGFSQIQDGLACAIRLLCFLKEQKMTLAEACGQLPDFAIPAQFHLTE